MTYQKDKIHLNILKVCLLVKLFRFSSFEEIKKVFSLNHLLTKILDKETFSKALNYLICPGLCLVLVLLIQRFNDEIAKHKVNNINYENDYGGFAVRFCKSDDEKNSEEVGNHCPNSGWLNFMVRSLITKK